MSRPKASRSAKGCPPAVPGGSALRAGALGALGGPVSGGASYSIVLSTCDCRRRPAGVDRALTESFGGLAAGVREHGRPSGSFEVTYRKLIVPTRSRTYGIGKPASPARRRPQGVGHRASATRVSPARRRPRVVAAPSVGAVLYSRGQHTPRGRQASTWSVREGGCESRSPVAS